jgi:hypothetical protein
MFGAQIERILGKVVFASDKGGRGAGDIER